MDQVKQTDYQKQIAEMAAYLYSTNQFKKISDSVVKAKQIIDETIMLTRTDEPEPVEETDTEIKKEAVKSILKLTESERGWYLAKAKSGGFNTSDKTFKKRDIEIAKAHIALKEAFNL